MSFCRLANVCRHLCYAEWARSLGGIFLVFLGKEPVVVLADPELVRQACVRHFSKLHDRPGLVNVPASSDKRIRILRAGVLVARGAYWGSVRAALNPLFHTAALQVGTVAGWQLSYGRRPYRYPPLSVVLPLADVRAAAAAGPGRCPPHAPHLLLCLWLMWPLV